MCECSEDAICHHVILSEFHPIPRILILGTTTHLTGPESQSERVPSKQHSLAAQENQTIHHETRDLSRRFRPSLSPPFPPHATTHPPDEDHPFSHSHPFSLPFFVAAVPRFDCVAEGTERREGNYARRALAEKGPAGFTLPSMKAVGESQSLTPSPSSRCTVGTHGKRLQRRMVRQAERDHKEVKVGGSNLSGAYGPLWGLQKGTVRGVPFCFGNSISETGRTRH